MSLIQQASFGDPKRSNNLSRVRFYRQAARDVGIISNENFNSPRSFNTLLDEVNSEEEFMERLPRYFLDEKKNEAFKERVEELYQDYEAKRDARLKEAAEKAAEQQTEQEREGFKPDFVVGDAYVGNSMEEAENALREQQEQAAQQQKEQEDAALRSKEEEEQRLLDEKEKEDAALRSKDEEERLRDAEIEAGRTGQDPDFFDSLYNEISNFGQSVIDTVKSFYEEKMQRNIEKAEDTGLYVDSAKIEAEKAKIDEIVQSYPEGSLRRGMAEEFAKDATTAQQLEKDMGDFDRFINETDPKEFQNFLEENKSTAMSWEAKFVRDRIDSGEVKDIETLFNECVKHEEARGLDPERAKQEDILAVKESIDIRLEREKDSLMPSERYELESRRDQLQAAADRIDERIEQAKEHEILEKYNEDIEKGPVSFDKGDYSEATREDIVNALAVMETERGSMEEKYGELGRDHYNGDIREFVSEVALDKIPAEEIPAFKEELKEHGCEYAVTVVDTIQMEQKEEHNKAVADKVVDMAAKHNEMRQSGDEKAYNDWCEKEYRPFVDDIHAEYGNYGHLKEELGEYIRENKTFQKDAEGITVELQESYMTLSDEMQQDRLHEEFEKNYFTEHFTRGEELLVVDGLDEGVEDYLVIRDNQGHTETFPLDAEDQRQSVRDAMDAWSVEQYKGRPELAREDLMEQGKTDAKLEVTKEDIEKYAEVQKNKTEFKDRQMSLEWNKEGTEVEKMVIEDGKGGGFAVGLAGETLKSGFNAIATAAQKGEIQAGLEYKVGKDAPIPFENMTEAQKDAYLWRKGTSEAEYDMSMVR